MNDNLHPVMAMALEGMAPKADQQPVELLSAMDRAVLQMPIDLAMSDVVSRVQFYERVQSLIERIDSRGL